MFFFITSLISPVRLCDKLSHFTTHNEPHSHFYWQPSKVYTIIIFLIISIKQAKKHPIKLNGAF